MHRAIHVRFGWALAHVANVEQGAELMPLSKRLDAYFSV